jgi:CreA protein
MVDTGQEGTITLEGRQPRSVNNTTLNLPRLQVCAHSVSGLTCPLVLDIWMIAMRATVLTFASFIALAVPAFAQTRIDAINTNFRWLGPDDKIVVERYDDPKVTNVSCYLSRAETGGVKGGLGFAEDPSRFSIACRAVGPIAIPLGLTKSEVIAFASASLFFKTFQIHRSVDPEKNALVYTVVSTKLVNGSPFNSISVVAAGVR